MDVNQLLNTVEKKSKESIKANNPKPPADSSFNNVMNSISKNWETTSSESEIESLKKELEEAKRKIKYLEKMESPLSKNEEKILAAIRTESVLQNTDSPIISYNKYRKVYKVSSSYYRQSIQSLIDRGMIAQKECSYSGKVPTFCWKILK